MKKLAIFSVLSTCFLTSLSAQTVVIDEDFQQGIPGSWSIVINDTNTLDESVIAEFAPGWVALPDPDNISDTVAGSCSFFTEPSGADRWLITPAFTVGSYGNFLAWKAKSHDPSYLDGYYVMISTTDSQTASFTDTLATVAFENPEWTEYRVDLSALDYLNQTIHVGFRLRSYDKFKLYLDSVNITINDPVGINELSETAIELAPNPATTSFFIQGEALESVQIIGLNGQVVLKQQISANQAIDISELLPGTYIVEVQTATGVGRERLVKR